MKSQFAFEAISFIDLLDSLNRIQSRSPNKSYFSNWTLGHNASVTDRFILSIGNMTLIHLEWIRYLCTRFESIKRVSFNNVRYSARAATAKSELKIQKNTNLKTIFLSKFTIISVFPNSTVNVIHLLFHQLIETISNQLNIRFNKTIHFVCAAIWVTCKCISKLELTFSKSLPANWCIQFGMICRKKY